MNFIQAVQSLVDEGVEFVIIGGWSAILHGSVYVTRDLDVCYSRAPANLKRLAKALSPFHPVLRDLPPGLPFLWDDVTLRNGTVFTLKTDLGDIDLLAEVAGVGVFDQVSHHSVVMQAFGREVRVLDLPGLIAAKRASGRPKDQLALPELEALLEATQED